MSAKTLRVRIIHDSNSEDPREWDDMCEIVRDERWSASIDRQICDLIVRTNGWRAMEEMATVAGHLTLDQMIDNEARLQNDTDFRDTWLEAVKDELIVETFHTQHEKYVAHTTPDLCKRVGTPWERAAEVMQGSIGTFKQWVEGDVYGFVIEAWIKTCACEDCDAGEWVETDSCWGFYGSDPFENGMALHVPESLHDQLRNAQIEYNY